MVICQLALPYRIQIVKWGGRGLGKCFLLYAYSFDPVHLLKWLLLLQHSADKHTHEGKSYLSLSAYMSFTGQQLSSVPVTDGQCHSFRSESTISIAHFYSRSQMAVTSSANSLYKKLPHSKMKFTGYSPQIRCNKKTWRLDIIGEIKATHTIGHQLGLLSGFGFARHYVLLSEPVM